MTKKKTLEEKMSKYIDFHCKICDTNFAGLDTFWILNHLDLKHHGRYRQVTRGEAKMCLSMEQV